MSEIQPDIAIQKRFSTEQLMPLLDLLEKAVEIVITTHHRPDGDAMGSSLGLYNYLLKKGFKVTVITPSEYPDFLYWLPGNEFVLNYEDTTQKTKCDTIIERADVIFCLDFNWMNRVEKMKESLLKSNAKRVLIDHHLNPEKVFDIIYSYSDACSTCELVYDVIAGMNDESLIDKNVAECIYCGIMTDTNSFRFASMKVRTHYIVAHLMSKGAENFRIHERVYDTSTEDRLRLLGFSLYEKLIVLKEYNTAYIVLSNDDLARFNFKSGDTEGFVNYALSIRGIRLAAFFTERDGAVKISFRSKNDFSVQELSSKHFRGGGHKNASGGFSEETLQETVQKFLDVLPEYKAQLTN